MSFSSKSGARREVERHLQSPVHGEPRARREELVVARRGLERPPGRELLVRVRHHEAACVELRRRRAQVPVVRRVRAEPRDVHAEDVVARVAVDDPVREREADACALREAGHAPAGRPVVRDAVDRPDERVAVGRERERAVHPAADPDVLQDGEAPEADRELGHDAVELLGEERPAEVPVRALDLPMTRVLLVHAEQHAVALALQVGEALEVGDGGHVARRSRRPGGCPSSPGSGGASARAGGRRPPSCRPCAPTARRRSRRARP